jgi:hypothetical protein
MTDYHCTDEYFNFFVLVAIVGMKPGTMSDIHCIVTLHFIYLVCSGVDAV